jgi:peptidoglycan-associated lipoprotein
MKQLFSVLIILSTLLIGCAEKKVVKPTEAPQPQTMEQKGKEGEASKETISEQKVAKVESKESPSKTEEVSGMFPDIHFDYDKYDIRNDAKPALKSVADYLIKNPSEKVLIEGHCDERGTSEYNLGLGDRRAKATKDYLLSLGVPSSRISTISYGKEKPLCDEHAEDCWAKNRRAHLVLLKR